MSILETTSQVCLMVQSVVISYIGYGHLFKPDGNLSELGFTYKPRSVSCALKTKLRSLHAGGGSNSALPSCSARRQTRA
jgi:hypothetical protein